MNNRLKLLIAVILPLAVGGISGFFTVTGIGSWYQYLQKPSWNPPNAIFGPVWTTLYVLMGIAWYGVWVSDADPALKKKAHWLFALQLFLNFWWSIIFFDLHAIGWALVEIIVLWVSILLTIVYFGKIRKWSAWLLVPYISWVSFATLLTYTIWTLNR